MSPEWAVFSCSSFSLSYSSKNRKNFASWRGFFLPSLFSASFTLCAFTADVKTSSGMPSKLGMA